MSSVDENSNNDKDKDNDNNDNDIEGNPSQIPCPPQENGLTSPDHWSVTSYLSGDCHI